MGKKMIVEARKLKGFRDYHPLQVRNRKKIIDTLVDVALKAGFQPITTPALEYSETLLGSGGEETDKEVYRFRDHGDREVALRFDLTVPFARYVAENQGTITFPFKKIQIGDVWRGEKPQKGRYREFCQGDLDIVGVDSLAADIEVIISLTQTLNGLIPVPFTVSLGHRLLLAEIIKAALPGLAAQDEVQVFIALDKLTKIGRDNVIGLLAAIAGTTPDGSAQLIDLLTTRTTDGHTDLPLIKKFLTDRSQGLQDFVRFEETAAILQSLMHDGLGKIRVDLSIARGLGYYTGIVFETQIDQLVGFGSVSSGGRYNRLISRFSNQEIPGVGGSIGVDRLLAAFEELGHNLADEEQGIFVAIATEDAREYGFQIALALRAMGYQTDIAVKPGKIAGQFKFADKRGYAFVITVGGHELDSRSFSFKTMATGEEIRDIPRDSLLSFCRERLS